MALTEAKMKDELMALGLYGTEAEAAEAWAVAFDNYFQDAATMGVPVAPGSTAAAKSAMQAGLVGLSTAGAAAIMTGITAYWGVVASAASSIWAGTLAAVPPTTLAAIQAALEAVFAANIAAEASKEDAMTAIAAVLHANTLGGLANWPPPPGPGPQPIV